MPPTVIDRRAYKPLCVYCCDTGCPLCEERRATMLSERMDEEDYTALREECMAWVSERLGVNRGTYMELRYPRTDAELLNLVMDAMIFGILREQSKRHIADVPSFDAVKERFERLIW